MTKDCVCSWSGGKDSCYALVQAMMLGYTPHVLLNVLNEAGQISRSHGIPYPILKAQADKAGLPLHCISSSWKDYEMHFTNALTELKEKYHLVHAVFGDIDLQEHRDWEEKVCANSGLTAVLPLWKQNRKALVLTMLETGIASIIVSCNELMGEKFIGRPITSGLINELEMLGIDPCGENGEYHTLVLDCPLFSSALNVAITEKMCHNNYWFGKLELTAKDN
jgi:uncharacterized protein (TIGR00290 family)